MLKVLVLDYWTVWKVYKYIYNFSNLRLKILLVDKYTYTHGEPAFNAKNETKRDGASRKASRWRYLWHGALPTCVQTVDSRGWRANFSSCQPSLSSPYLSRGILERRAFAGMETRRIIPSLDSARVKASLKPTKSICCLLLSRPVFLNLITRRQGARFAFTRGGNEFLRTCLITPCV